jgi:putative acetyltransferase
VTGGAGTLAIREALPADLPGVEQIYAAAFPQDDLRPLVRELSSLGPRALALVAVAGSALVGHAVFTTCGLAGQQDRIALLGPVAVAPERQGQGIGSTLIRTGLDRLRKGGTRQVHVLGDPAYYRRFGFARDDGVEPPYALPAEWRAAWQLLSLRDDVVALRGTLAVPPPWQRPDLWAP